MKWNANKRHYVHNTDFSALEIVIIILSNKKKTFLSCLFLLFYVVSVILKECLKIKVNWFQISFQFKIYLSYSDIFFISSENKCQTLMVHLRRSIYQKNLIPTNENIEKCILDEHPLRLKWSKNLFFHWHLEILNLIRLAIRISTRNKNISNISL